MMYWKNLNRKAGRKTTHPRTFAGLHLLRPILLSGFGFPLLFSGILILSANTAGGANSCFVYLFQDREFTEGTAGNVFIRFAKHHIGTHYAAVLDSQLNIRSPRGGWTAAIRSRTTNWSPKQAEDFLNIFQERLGAHGALRLTARSLSHLEILIPARQTEAAFQAIKDRVAFYDSYMGEEKTTRRLFISLDGFTDRDIDRTRELTEFLEDYYGSKKSVVQIMERNIGLYSKIGREDIEPGMLFLDKHLGRKVVIEMTFRDKRKMKGYLSLNKLRDLQKILRVLIDEVIPPSPKSNEVIREGLLALIERQGSSLIGSRNLTQFLETHFGESLPAEIMNEDLQAFALVPGGMRFGKDFVEVFDNNKYLKDRRQAAEFIKFHRRKLFAGFNWRKIVENHSHRFGQPWRNIWD